MIIGGCTKDEKFVSEVTCLDPLRRSRLEVAKLPNTDMESENENKKWVELHVSLSEMRSTYQVSNQDITLR